MVIYVCKNCNYRSEKENISECSFCGMDCIEAEKDAGDLIQEIEDLFG